MDPLVHGNGVAQLKEPEELEAGRGEVDLRRILGEDLLGEEAPLGKNRSWLNLLRSLVARLKLLLSLAARLAI